MSGPRTESGKQAVKMRGLFGGETAERATKWVLAIEAEASSSLDLWTMARHVATDSSAHHPRYHDPSGECAQYGDHIHQPAFIVWEREA